MYFKHKINIFIKKEGYIKYELTPNENKDCMIRPG